MTALGDLETSADRLDVLLADSEESRRRGEYTAGAALCRAAISLAAALGERTRLAFAHRLLALHLNCTGEYEEAIAACERARILLTDTDENAEVCRAALVQAFALNELGLSEQALDCLNAAEQIAERLQDPSLLFWVQNRIGVVYDTMGERHEARNAMLTALDLADETDDEAMFSILNNLVDNAMSLVPQLRQRGEESEAEAILLTAVTHASRALALADAADQPYLRCLALGNLGVIEALQGRYDTGLQTEQTARLIAVKYGYRSLELATLQYSPRILLMKGATDQAITPLVDVLHRAEELGEQPVQLDTLQALVEAHERNGQYREALGRLKEYHSMEQQVRSARLNTRSRVLAQQIELENVRREAAAARAQAAEDRAHSQRLEADKLALQLRTIELERSAYSDSLTGIGNRRYVDNELTRMFALSVRHDSSLCVALLDIDHFKKVNDTFGHAIGDAVLVRVAELIVRHSRTEDLVARYGGEEFLLAFSDIDAWSATRMCERLREGVEREDWSEIAPGMSITVSAGVAARSDSVDVHELIDRADQQLYRAKQSGRNRVKQRVA
jgi:diguanylate cyclase (GGDEF)-like protein